MPSDTSAQFPKESNQKGEFVRQASAFREWIKADGSTPYPPARDRYHLYVSLACPWAHRTIIVRKLKGLEDVIGMTVVDPIRDDKGWRFREGRGHTEDPIEGFEYLSEAYLRTEPGFDGRVTVPTLWDKQTGRVVNNESADIIRMLDAEFERCGASGPDLYPAALRDEIDTINQTVYDHVNNGVYRCGFASSQAAYDEAFEALFRTLDVLDQGLATQRYLCGSRITEADWRLFTTLIRFDAVYVGHFKCNLRRIADYPNLSGFVRELYQWRGVAATVDMRHIKAHYYRSHKTINPTGVVPLGPQLDLDAAHGREHLPALAIT